MNIFKDMGYNVEFKNDVYTLKNKDKIIRIILNSNTYEINNKLHYLNSMIWEDCIPDELIKILNK